MRQLNIYIWKKKRNEKNPNNYAEIFFVES